MSRIAMIRTLVFLCTGLLLPAAVSAQATSTQGAQTAIASTVRDTSAWRDARPLRAEELLARFPGVAVRQAPGGGVSVRIRGSSTLGNGEPLYVVDGMEVDQLGAGLLGINPAEIARIEVLKDAAATAYYGMRGSNGVVVIPTKRGRQ